LAHNYTFAEHAFVSRNSDQDILRWGAWTGEYKPTTHTYHYY